MRPDAITFGGLSKAMYIPLARRLERRFLATNALTALGQNIGASPSDIIALLTRAGRDTAGAISIGAPGSDRLDTAIPIAGAADLAAIIDNLPHKPFLLGEEGISMSLAGTQHKLGVIARNDGTLAVPTDGAPGTHILKPDSTRLDGSAALRRRVARISGRLRTALHQPTRPSPPFRPGLTPFSTKSCTPSNTALASSKAI